MAVQDVQVLEQLKLKDQIVKLYYMLGCIHGTNLHSHLATIKVFEPFFETEEMVQHGEKNIRIKLIHWDEWKLDEVIKTLDPEGKLLSEVDKAHFNKQPEDDKPITPDHVLNIQYLVINSMRNFLIQYVKIFIQEHANSIYQNRKTYEIPDWIFKRGSRIDLIDPEQKIELEKFTSFYQASLKKGIQILHISEHVKKYLLWILETIIANQRKFETSNKLVVDRFLNCIGWFFPIEASDLNAKDEHKHAQDVQPQLKPAQVLLSAPAKSITSPVPKANTEQPKGSSNKSRFKLNPKAQEFVFGP